MKGGHSGRSHARLSASGSTRWLACSPSIKLEERYRDKESSVFAKEGTLAHEFADFDLRLFNGEITERRHKEATDKLKKHELFSREMPTEVAKYTSYVIERFYEIRKITPEAKLTIEERLDFSHIVKKGFGTLDGLILADDLIEVIDLKYGKGVKVEAENNSQLMLYGLGALRANELLYDIKTVKLTIVQPRLNSISSWDISVEELEKWAEDTVRPKAELAYKGEGETVAGDHCRWCKAKPRCRAYTNLANAVARLEFAEPQTLSEEEVIEVYESLPRLIEWSKVVALYLKNKALSGDKIKGYKLVEGTSRRKFLDEESVADTLKGLGFEEKEIYKTKLRGITDISNLMSKDDFDREVGPFVVRPKGVPTLVPESDKRPEYDITEAAKKDFEE